MSVTLQWPGGEHDFALKIGQLRKLQDSCNAGPEEVFNRLRLGTWRVNDIIEPMRLGLIGGGVASDEAARMVMTLIDACLMSVTLQWPGGEHDFALKISQLRKLQDACNAGPEEVFNRLRLGTWRVNDIIEPLRLGLIGGGTAPDEAARTVMTLLEQNPIVQFKLTSIAVMAAPLLGTKDDPGGLSEFKLTALAIMADALLGPKDDQVGEEKGDAAPPKNGGSPDSTAPVQ